MARNTKDRILEAALALFARNGYAATNIKDISEAVGIVKSAFYRHFNSKEEVFDAFCLESVMQLSGIKEVVFDGISGTIHDDVFQSGNGFHGCELHLPWQAGGESVDIILVGIDTFRL